MHEREWSYLFDLGDLRPALPDRPPLRRYIPPRGVPERTQDAINNPRVRESLIEAIERPVAAGMEDWYKLNSVYDRFKRLRGADAERAFIRRLDLFGATSPEMKVPDNIKTGSYYQYLDEQGMPLPELPPEGYGAHAQQLHRMNADKIINGAGWDFKTNPKPPSFRENLAGNEDPLTADRHYMRKFGMSTEDPRFLETRVQVEIPLANGKKKKVIVRPQDLFARGKLTMAEALKQPDYWTGKPRDTEYGALERYQQDLARGLGYTTAGSQGRLWVGAGNETGLGSAAETFAATLGRRIAYTAGRMGARPEEVRDLWIKGQIPLLSVAGAAAGTGGLLSLIEPHAPAPEADFARE